jgi:hypothetical protein
MRKTVAKARLRTIRTAARAVSCVPCRTQPRPVLRGNANESNVIHFLPIATATNRTDAKRLSLPPPIVVSVKMPVREAILTPPWFARRDNAVPNVKPDLATATMTWRQTVARRTPTPMSLTVENAASPALSRKCAAAAVVRGSVPVYRISRLAAYQKSFETKIE